MDALDLFKLMNDLSTDDLRKLSKIVLDKIAWIDGEGE
jgi:hypothetical protein